MEKPRKKGEVQADIDKAEARIIEIDATVDKLGLERAALTESWGSTGKLRDLASELFRAELCEGDEEKIYFNVTSDWDQVRLGWYVDKVTAKRIYAHREDGGDQGWFALGTGSSTSHGKIRDLERVLAEIVARES